MTESLADLFGDWPNPGPDSTYLERSVTEARRVPLNRLSVEQARALLCQSEGVAEVLPRALALLSDDPLVEGDYYPGDLLVAVLRLDGWDARAAQRAEVLACLDRLDPTYWDYPVESDLDHLAHEFRRRWG